MKLSNDRFELAGTAKIFHYLQQDVSSHRIEGLGQINDGPKEVAMLLPSILLELEWGEYHVGMQFDVVSGNHTGFLVGDPARCWMRRLSRMRAKILPAINE